MADDLEKRVTELEYKLHDKKFFKGFKLLMTLVGFFFMSLGVFTLLEIVKGLS